LLFAFFLFLKLGSCYLFFFFLSLAMIIYRTMKPYDIAAGMALCRTAGWNQLERDWKIFLHLSPKACLVASREDKVVGTVATIRYQKFFSWIGMVLVDPEYKRQGIGMQLLKEALQILHNEETIKLDATPAGREVYLKLNFVDEYRLVRMSTIVAPEKLIVSAARALHKDDLFALSEFDREIFGADRKPLLEWMLEGAPQLAFLVKEKKEILGYCMGRPGHNFTHIGPIIAKNSAIAKDLVFAALKNCIGSHVILDAFYCDPEWIEWLKSIGFSEQRPFIRMYHGSNKFHGVPEKQFAILGPEFG
jgi:GNAT superfamily N-acetyltransferase